MHYMVSSGRMARPVQNVWFLVTVLVLVCLWSVGTFVWVSAVRSMKQQTAQHTGIDHDVLQLLDTLTIEEKVGQMFQIDISVFAIVTGAGVLLDKPLLTTFLDKYYLGSLLDSPTAGGAVGSFSNLSPDEWRQLITSIQDLCLAHGSKLPCIYGLDTIHGAQYVQGAAIFPQQLNLAATMNVTHAFNAGVVGAKDTRYCGIPWVFSPILGVASHQAWPRYFETFGESTAVVKELGEQMIEGYQGNGSAASISQSTKVAACGKHFLAYPLPRNGADRGPVWVSENALYDIYVPTFRGAVSANVRTMMSAYHELNGEPIGESKRYLQTLLRDELQFNGLLVTDYNVINDLKDLHHAADDYANATLLAMNQTSIDMCMAGNTWNFWSDLMALVKADSVSEARLDESVARILQLKKDLGLLTAPYPPTDVPNTVGAPEDWQQALEAARESIVLLKNAGNVLPIATSPQHLHSTVGLGLSAYPDYVPRSPHSSATPTFALLGPSIDSLVYLSGGWTLHWQGASKDSEFPFGSSIASAFKSLVSPDSTTVLVETGVNIDGSYSNDEWNAAMNAAKQADYILIAIGETHYAEAPGDVGSILLADGQAALVTQVRTLVGAKVPIVCVLVEGRPLILGGVSDACDAIVGAMLPGPTGGQAISEIVLGLINPSGRLPFTYPQFSNQIPLTHWRTASTAEAVALFDFGTGLSYSTWNYSLQLSTNSLHAGDSFSAHVTVCNTDRNGRAGGQSVVLFVSDKFRSGIAPELKVVKRFSKVRLAAQTCTAVDFGLSVWDDLSFHGLDGQQNIQRGQFDISLQDLANAVTVTLYDTQSRPYPPTQTAHGNFEAVRQ